MHDKRDGEEVVEGKQIGDSVANKDVQVLNVYTVKMFALQSGNERNLLRPFIHSTLQQRSGDGYITKATEESPS